MKALVLVKLTPFVCFVSVKCRFCPPFTHEAAVIQGHSSSFGCFHFPAPKTPFFVSISFQKELFYNGDTFPPLGPAEMSGNASDSR